MSVQALTGPVIQAKGYTKGRKFVQATTVRWVVLHTAEGSTDEINLGNYFRGTTAGSSNCGIGQDGGYAQYVNYGDTPWTNPPLNEESDTCETCGFAAWTRDQWLAHPAMLETIAQWIAWRCAVRGIPLVLLSAADLQAGKSGVLDHRTVNAVYHQSTHWDVGYNFPWDVVMPKAQGYGQVPVQETPVPVTTDWAAYYNAGYTVAYIKSIQDKLNRVGGYGLVVDGIRGPKTQAAVRDFQAKHGLVVDALPGPNTNSVLDALLAPKPASPAALSVDGDEGPLTIKAEQRRLAALGYYKGDIDGLRGPLTIKAEQSLLRDKGYYKGKIDGLFGPQSITAEQQYLAALGYYKGKIDGLRGPQTVSALQTALNAGRF